MKRYRPTSKVLHGEAGSVDPRAIEEGMRKILEKCEKHPTNHIFHVDETRIFVKLLPKRTYLAPFQDRKIAIGIKDLKVKDRISIHICANAKSSFEVPITIIGKSKNYRCFKQGSPRLKYFS